MILPPGALEGGLPAAERHWWREDHEEILARLWWAG